MMCRNLGRIYWLQVIDVMTRVARWVFASAAACCLIGEFFYVLLRCKELVCARNLFELECALMACEHLYDPIKLVLSTSSPELGSL